MKEGVQVLMLDRENWPKHRPWALLALVLFLGSAAWFVTASLGQTGWPGGSSLAGFSFGVAGGIIIVFEFLLWFKKRVRVWRIGRAQSWMRAHIWLGLLCLPLLVLHSGFRLGGALSAVLMLLLVIVVASGIWGLVLQGFLPTRMLDDVPAETIHSQIPLLAAQLIAETQGLVARTCGTGRIEVDNTREVPDNGDGHLVVGAMRTVGSVQGKVLATVTPLAPIPGTEVLATFFSDVLVPYLRGGAKAGSALAAAPRSALMFANLRTQLVPEAHGVVGILEDYADQRRQWDQQARLYFWLHNWLLIHFPLSVALLVLMAVHVWATLRFW